MVAAYPADLKDPTWARLQQAARAWQTCPLTLSITHHTVWRNRFISLELKVRRYRQKVVPIFLYCSGTWTWTAALASKLRIVERAALRVIMQSKPQTAEPYPDYLHRVNACNLKYYAVRYHTLPVIVLQSIHKVAGNLDVPGMFWSPAGVVPPVFDMLRTIVSWKSSCHYVII